MGSLVQMTGKLLGYDPAGDAAKIQQRAAKQQGDIAAQQWTENKNLLQSNQTQNEAALNPYIDSGNRAWQIQQALAGTLGPDAQQKAFADYQASPGVEFMRQQGMKGIEQNLAQTGTGGGTRLQAISKFNQGLAMQDFANQFARTSGIADVGRNATSDLLTTRGQTTSNIVSGGNAAAGDRAMAIGNAAAARAGAKQADAQLLNNLGNDVVSVGTSLVNPMSLFAPKAPATPTGSYNGYNTYASPVPYQKKPWE